MRNENGYPTTPKLQALLQRQANSEDVLSDLIPYARKGYQGGEDGLILAAEQGSQQAQKVLAEMLTKGDHHLQSDQVKRALATCDLGGVDLFNVLEKQANSGAEWAMDQLKKLLPENTAYQDRLGTVLESSLLRNLGAGDEKLWSRHRIKSDLDAMQQELESEGNSPMERLLIRRVVLTYMALHYFETLYFQNLEKPQNHRMHQLVLQRLQQCNDRYLASIKALSQVRKLRVPNIQVNIGEKQINVNS